MRLATEIRQVRKRVEGIALGQPRVVAAMIDRLDNYEDAGAKSAPILQEQRTRELLQDALTSMHEALAAHAAGVLNAECVVARFEVEGAALSNHAALWKGRLINFPEIQRVCRELLSEDVPHSAASRDLLPTALRQIRQQRLRSALLALAPLEERMFEENRGLVGWGLSRFQCSRQERQDLETVGLAALHRSVQRFRPEDGYAFATYAGKVILVALAEELRGLRSVRRLRNPNSANQEGVACLSLHQQLAGADSSELLAVVADRNSVDAQVEVSAKEDTALARSLVRSALEQLEPLPRRVVALYFGLDSGEPLTLSAVGEQLGISVSQVRILVASGKRQLAAVLEQGERTRRCLEALEVGQDRERIEPKKKTTETHKATKQTEITMEPEAGPRIIARKKGASQAPAAMLGESVPADAVAEEAKTKLPVAPSPLLVETGQAAPATALLPVGVKVDVVASMKALVRAVDELGTAPKLIAGAELWKITEEYYQSLRSARIAGRSSEESSGVPTDRVRRSKELVESVHRTLYRVWPLGHIDETQGFRLEGEMLQMKKDPTGTHLVLALDATVKYLQSLPR
jgi:RNA polymerase sigma factor (sigma-70 family)